MKKQLTKFLFAITLLFSVSLAKAQTAMDFSGNDCDGNFHNLFADLDAGKAVVLHFYMPSCGSCPPSAQKTQAMTDNINAMYPGMVVGYAFPFQNTTTCAYSSSWVSSNGLSSLYAPMDSGATMVSYYGGFGMPTVVLLGGTDHRTMFSTLNFVTNDTTEMRDSILGLLNPTSLNEMPEAVAKFSIYPNPASDLISVNIELKENSNLRVEIMDISGRAVSLLMDEKQSSGIVQKQFNIASLPNGIYLVRLVADGKTTTQKLNVIH